MSLFNGPDEHAANPPETWRVERCGRRWNLCTAGGSVSSGHDTKRAAEQARSTGFLTTLYADEARWYAGESVRGWNPYRELKSRPA
jgi:hypothetical protein